MTLHETFTSGHEVEFDVPPRASVLGSRRRSLNAKLTPSMQPNKIAETFSRCDSLVTLEILLPKVDRITLEIFSRPHHCLTTLRICYIGTVTVAILQNMAQTTRSLRNLEIDALKFENVQAISDVVHANSHLREISILRQNLRPGNGSQKFFRDVVLSVESAKNLEKLNVKPSATYWGV